MLCHYVTITTDPGILPLDYPKLDVNKMSPETYEMWSQVKDQLLEIEKEKEKEAKTKEQIETLDKDEERKINNEGNKAINKDLNSSIDDTQDNSNKNINPEEANEEIRTSDIKETNGKEEENHLSRMDLESNRPSTLKFSGLGQK